MMRVRGMFPGPIQNYDVFLRKSFEPFPRQPGDSAYNTCHAHVLVKSTTATNRTSLGVRMVRSALYDVGVEEIDCLICFFQLSNSARAIVLASSSSLSESVRPTTWEHILEDGVPSVG